MTDYILRITCPDQIGIIYKISEILLKNKVNIIRNDEFVDDEKNLFFMRTVFSGEINAESVSKEIEEILAENSIVELIINKTKNVVLLVTKEHHCLSDLLIRNEFKELNFNILSVIGNHENLKDLTEKFNIPFHFVSTENISREEHENKVIEIGQSYNPDYLVLAKFMRILSPNFVKKFQHKIINIHHSFLPAFIGANPYKQAYERGVKIIGATAHFVTDNLDEGPIIYQDIIKVSHSKNAKEMSKLGRDCEKSVLSNALKLVFDDKVFIDGNKTIIFE